MDTISEMPGLEAARPQSVIVWLVDQLRDAIISGRFQAGEPIRQESIASQYEVSRTPVREALRLLEAEGWIEQRPHRGAVVAALDPEDVIELFEVRAALETLAVRRSFPRLGDFNLKAIEKAYKAMVAAPESDIGAHNAFHMALYAAAGARLQRLVRNHLDAAQRYLRFEHSALKVSDIDRREHEALLKAALSRDVSKAVAVIESHVGGGGHGIARSLRSRAVEREKATKRGGGGRKNGKKT